MQLKPYYRNPEEEWLLLPERGVRQTEGSAEELIRQWLLNELVTTYRFPSDWLGSRIILVDPDSPNTPVSGFFGIVMLTPAGNPFLWLSIRGPGHASEAERILREALLTDSHAGVGIASDGSTAGTLVLRRRFDADQCEVVNDMETYEGQIRMAETTYVATDPLERAPRAGRCLLKPCRNVPRISSSRPKAT